VVSRQQFSIGSFPSRARRQGWHKRILKTYPKNLNYKRTTVVEKGAPHTTIFLNSIGGASKAPQRRAARWTPPGPLLGAPRTHGPTCLTTGTRIYGRMCVRTRLWTALTSIPWRSEAPCPVPRVPEQPSPRRPKKRPIHLGIPIAYRRPNLTGASEYPHGHKSSRMTTSISCLANGENGPRQGA